MLGNSGVFAGTSGRIQGDSGLFVISEGDGKKRRLALPSLPAFLEGRGGGGGARALPALEPLQMVEFDPDRGEDAELMEGERLSDALDTLDAWAIDERGEEEKEDDEEGEGEDEGGADPPPGHPPAPAGGAGGGVPPAPPLCGEGGSSGSGGPGGSAGPGHPPESLAGGAGGGSSGSGGPPGPPGPGPMLPPPGAGPPAAAAAAAAAGGAGGAPPPPPPVVHRAPARYRGNWIYVRIGDLGHIVYDEYSGKMSAHCPCAAHNRGKDKCHYGRTYRVPDREYKPGEGRYLGLLMAWLQLGKDCTDKPAHSKCKETLNKVQGFELRRRARGDLQRMAADSPAIASLFQKTEREVIAADCARGGEPYEVP